MNSKFPLKHRFPVCVKAGMNTPVPNRNRQRGVALVIVLSVIVLLTALIVGFLLRAGVERSSTASYSAKAATRQLADTAVNLVQGQINDATSQGTDKAWASQPGAVRVFDNNGNLNRIYRLYSSGSMTTTTPSDLANDLPPAGWEASPAAWVDLNAPVTMATGSNSSSMVSYPILDPRDPAVSGSSTVKMDGFFLGTGTNATPVPGTTAVPLASGTAANPAPMPVRWMYVLKDGSIATATTGTSGKVVTVSAATAANPIVGRIAFWTDDDTCKVNINTAAGSMSLRPDPSTGNASSAVLPAPWDIPRFNIGDEQRLFSRDQPVRGEYQRYPGHPASTDLYNILNGLGVPMGAASTTYPPNPGSATYLAGGSMPGATTSTQSGLFTLLPRYGDAYSSQGGTADTTAVASGTTSTANVVAVTLPQSRLYSSVGEFLYSGSASSTNPLQRELNLCDLNNTSTAVNRQQVETGKFFLTARNRAPEINLFGTPRISMWPIDSDWVTAPASVYPISGGAMVSPFDKLIAFCATTGTGSQAHQYFIQRHDSTSPTNDYDSIPRNKNLYGYLQSLTSKSIPGFAGNFQSKYGNNNECDQILTEMVDYIRCTDLYDHSVNDPNGQYAHFTPKSNSVGGGQVVPLHIGNTSGLGRMYTISEIGLLVICTADASTSLTYQAPTTVGGKNVSPVNGSANDIKYISNLPVSQYLRDSSGSICAWSGTSIETGGINTFPASGGPFPSNKTLADQYSPSDPGDGKQLSPGEKRLQAALLFEPASPMLGYDLIIQPDMNLNITGLNNIVIGGQTPFVTGTTYGDGMVYSMTSRLNAVNEYGGINGFQYFMSRGGVFSNKRYSGWGPVTSSASDAYRCVSQPFTLGSSASSLSIGANISGTNSSFSVQILVIPKGGSSPTQVVQTFNVTFPYTTTPLPDLIQSGLLTTVGTVTNTPMDWWGFGNRIAWSGSDAYISTSGGRLLQGCVFRNDVTSPGNPVLPNVQTISLQYYKNASGVKTPSGSLNHSDVVRTLVAADGDYRLLMAKATVKADGSTDMKKYSRYDDSSYKLVHSFMQSDRSDTISGCDLSGKLLLSATYNGQLVPKVITDVTSQVPSWDWDSGPPDAPDGAYANKPEEGNIYVNGQAPYYNAGNVGNIQYSASYFTPNRIIPSPVMFGSLPTGVKENITWRTLLFRPNSTPSDSGITYRHDNLGTPPDHLLLDLFWMPVVEPYAISEPFSTAGKINLNYQIVPFTYITRDTGVRAVLGSELMARVPLGAESSSSFSNGTPNSNYKPHRSVPSASNLVAVTYGGSTVTMARLSLNLDEVNGTLRQFSDKFKNWDIFKSASEVCDIYLVPKGYTWPGFDLKWYGNDFALVGDNVRERPYADIYPRLTTKSNSFTVHFTVQALKNPSSNPTQWNEDRGAVLAEYRGSTSLERYLDPNDSNIPDYGDGTDPTTKTPIDKFYKWRIISNDSFP